ncbi:MAG: M14 family metallopeptidase [Rikenellaceae bacterium]
MKIYSRSVRIAISLFITVFICQYMTAQNTNLKDPRFITHYEKNNFNRTPRYAETVEFCKLLDENSPVVTYTSIGVSPQGREIPLLIVDKDGLTTPDVIRAKGRSVVLVEAAIHAGEPDGKDAGLMLIRDIAIYKKFPRLLDNVSLLFIPIINVDGHEDFGSFYRINQNGPEEVGARFTAQRLNMNRDFIKADAPETRAFIKLYRIWMPELFMDIHVTNGADFQYVSTYGMDHCGFLNENLLNWTNSVYEVQLKSKMADSGFPIFPYFEFNSYTNQNAGVLPDNFPPQYSNGYASANNRIGILIENHIYKPYKQRVESSYNAILYTLEIVGANGRELQKEIALADEYSSSDKFRIDSLPLMFSHNLKDSVLVDFLTWQTKTEKSDLTGAEWTYSDRTAPVTIKMPLFTSYKKDVIIKLPVAYIVPQEQIATIELLDIHGIKYSKLERDTTFEVETYRFINPRWSEFPYEGRVTLTTDYTTQKELVHFNKGDIIVATSQPKVKIIAHLLEPKSPTSLVYWGFYNLYARPETEFWIRLSYMEVKGREMLAKDPVLKREFENKKATDPAFANNPQAILQFFMSKVREKVEPNVNRYPVGRIL